MGLSEDLERLRDGKKIDLELSGWSLLLKVDRLDVTVEALATQVYEELQRIEAASLKRLDVACDAFARPSKIPRHCNRASTRTSDGAMLVREV